MPKIMNAKQIADYTKGVFKKYNKLYKKQKLYSKDNYKLISHLENKSALYNGTYMTASINNEHGKVPMKGYEKDVTSGRFEKRLSDAINNAVKHHKAPYGRELNHILSETFKRGNPKYNCKLNHTKGLENRTHDTIWNHKQIANYAKSMSNKTRILKEHFDYGKHKKFAPIQNEAVRNQDKKFNRALFNWNNLEAEANNSPMLEHKAKYPMHAFSRYVKSGKLAQDVNNLDNKIGHSNKNVIHGTKFLDNRNHKLFKASQQFSAKHRHINTRMHIIKPLPRKEVKHDNMSKRVRKVSGQFHKNMRKSHVNHRYLSTAKLKKLNQQLKKISFGPGGAGRKINQHRSGPSIN